MSVSLLIGGSSTTKLIDLLDSFIHFLQKIVRLIHAFYLSYLQGASRPSIDKFDSSSLLGPEALNDAK